MGDWLSPDPWFGDEDDEISAALTNLKLHKPKTYTTQSLASYRAACIALRRRGVPGAVCRSHLSQLVLYRRAARAPHPTRRKGHPLPPLIHALYRAHPGLRAALAASVAPSAELCAS
jgi:hypothetical protein